MPIYLLGCEQKQDLSCLLLPLHYNEILSLNRVPVDPNRTRLKRGLKGENTFALENVTQTEAAQGPARPSGDCQAKNISHATP